MREDNEGQGLNQNKLPEQVKVKSLYKAVQLLFYFSGEDKELGVTELAQRSGVLKSTVYNVLATYEACGIVERNPRTNKYRLGLKILELSNQFYRNSGIRQVMRPYMDELAAQSGECVYLAARQDRDIIYMDAAFPPGSVGGRNMVGVSAPSYCTGIGKAILAFEPEEVWERVIGVQGGLKAFTENTITDGEALKRELVTIRSRGYSIDNMEHEYGVKCVAAPVKNYEGRVLAAISISGPSLRFSEERVENLAGILLDAARAGGRL